MSEYNKLVELLAQNPNQIEFNDVMAAIDEAFTFTPTEFVNGQLTNSAGENNGSCKVFALGQLLKLSEEQTLNCFGQYYRSDVLENPDNTDHQNIRNFMKTGWTGVNFTSPALVTK